MKRRLSILVPVGVLVLALSWVRLPYLEEGPGPAREVTPLIEVSGPERFPSEGRFILTSVSLGRLTAVGLIQAWLDSRRAVVPESAFVFPGETEEEADERALSEMDRSKIDASVVVLERLTGYPEQHGRGVLVEAVAPRCPAGGKLFPGDLITSINGRPVPDVARLRRILDGVSAGEELRLAVEAGGEVATVTVTIRPCEGSEGPAIGIVPVNNFPFDLTISSGSIGGPSAGLMWALGLYDLLTPGDLTAGRTIAGTGDIELDGSVLPIGGVEQKVVAAEAAEAGVFLVPAHNAAEARNVAGDGLALVPVRDFQDALDYLLSTGGETGKAEIG
jgi:Lon-like protease